MSVCCCQLAGTRACDMCPHGPGRAAPPHIDEYANRWMPKTPRYEPIDYNKLADMVAERINKGGQND